MDHHNWINEESLNNTDLNSIEFESSWNSPIRIIYKNINKESVIAVNFGFILKADNEINKLKDSSIIEMLKSQNIFSFSDLHISFK